MAWESDRILIATPTDTHASLIKELLEFDRPILCEKPITKNIDELSELIESVKKLDGKLDMVCQYKHLLNSSQTGPSVYNYFRHGNDGLVWDCMQIVGLANGTVDLFETSPVWQCRINGQELNIKHMDQAYVSEILDWINNPCGDLDSISLMHHKTHELEKKYGQNQ
jgi:hypothetical protein